MFLSQRSLKCPKQPPDPLNCGDSLFSRHAHSQSTGSAWFTLLRVSCVTDAVHTAAMEAERRLAHHAYNARDYANRTSCCECYTAGHYAKSLVHTLVPRARRCSLLETATRPCITVPPISFGSSFSLNRLGRPQPRQVHTNEARLARQILDEVTRLTVDSVPEANN